VIPVGRLAPKDQWDQNMLDLLFANELYPTGLQFKRTDGYPPNVDGCVLIIPGRYWSDRANNISEAISKYRWVLAVRAGDEENTFDPERVFHRNIKWWIQTPDPNVDYGDSRLFGVGFPPHFNTLTRQDRRLDVFVSAQNTHERRNDCFAALKRTNGVIQAWPTDGFTHGMPTADYAAAMCSTKIAPCPAGPASPDSFRLFEALEAHAVPIADDESPSGVTNYWRTVFPDAPFPILDSYTQLPGYVADQLAEWPANANRITAWWMRTKRVMARWLIEDLTELGAL
jgi:hypothetical protein